MIEPNQTAYIVKVTCPDEGMPNSILTMFYAVLTDDREKAEALVREAVKPEASIEMMDARLSQDTAKAIDLMPDYVRAL